MKKSLVLISTFLLINPCTISSAAAFAPEALLEKMHLLTGRTKADLMDLYKASTEAASEKERNEKAVELQRTQWQAVLTLMPPEKRSDIEIFFEALLTLQASNPAVARLTITKAPRSILATYNPSARYQTPPASHYRSLQLVLAVDRTGWGLKIDFSKLTLP